MCTVNRSARLFLGHELFQIKFVLFATSLNRTMKKNYTILFCLLLPWIVRAQSNFSEGFVVTHEADTLNGFIDYKEWAKNPDKITFKRSLNAEAQLFTENDIVYFEIFNKDEAYQRYILPISMDRIELPRLSVGPDTNKVIKAVFLKYIEKGKNINMLSYTDELKSRYYILNNNNLEELIYKKYFKDNVKDQFASDNRFKGQFLVISQQYPISNLNRFREKVNKATYTSSSIVPLVREINADSTSREKISSIRFFAGLTLNYGYTAYKGDFPLAKSASNKGAFTPGFTVGMDAFLNKRTKKLLFRNELSLFTNKASMTKEEASKTTSHSFEQTIVSISPQVIYHLYSNRNLRVNVGGGLSGNFGKTYNNFYKVIYANPSSGFGDINNEDGIEINKFWFVTPIRAGLVLNRSWEASIIYVYPLSSMSSFPLFSINNSTYKMGINYLFNSRN
jgi:hypothetical protein